MKVKVEFDMTPQEARVLMGLPEVETMQKDLMDQVGAKMKDSLDAMSDPEALFQKFMPLGAQSLEQYQKMMSGILSAATGGKSKSD